GAGRLGGGRDPERVGAGVGQALGARQRAPDPVRGPAGRERRAAGGGRGRRGALRPRPPGRLRLPAGRDRPLPGAGGAGGAAHRRRRHADRDLAAEQLLGSGGQRGGLRHRQHRPHRRRLPRGRVGPDPDADHVQGHEPLAGQRALQRLRRRHAGRLEAASSVVFVPGYGMAVAQAQHAVKELADLLEANGAEVRYAIHPVAGRMPGHMNVLLAEANVPYEQLVEPGDVNPTMETVDVAVVIGANDVVNPAAKEDRSSPLYGMPIIEVDRARTTFVLKRSMNPGFSGVENPLFYKPNTRMIFGDAKAVLSQLVGEFKEAAAA